MNKIKRFRYYIYIAKLKYPLCPLTSVQLGKSQQVPSCLELFHNQRDSTLLKEENYMYYTVNIWPRKSKFCDYTIQRIHVTHWSW